MPKNTAEGAINSKGSVLHFETKADFLTQADILLNKGDTILVKASHGMEFPEIVEKLQQLVI